VLSSEVPQAWDAVRGHGLGPKLDPLAELRLNIRWFGYLARPTIGTEGYP